MTVLIACDLDSTLISSRRSAATDVGDLVCVERRDGEPAAFMTAPAALTLAALAEQAAFVPVTTRTEAQLARVRLPGPVRYAIAANGGRLLCDGVVDEAWSRVVASRLAAVASFAEARARAQRFAASFEGRPHEVDGLFSFAVLPSAQVPGDAIDVERVWAARSGWRVSVQGRKVYGVPVGLPKSAAVAELAQRVDASVILAAGDSLLDADLFDVADLGIRPAHGELAAAGFSGPNVQVTSERGVLAGERIVEWFAAQVRSATGGLHALPATAASAPEQ